MCTTHQCNVQLLFVRLLEMYILHVCTHTNSYLTAFPGLLRLEH